VRSFLEDISAWEWTGAPPLGLVHAEDYPLRDKYLPKPIPPDVDTVLIEALLKVGDPTCLGLVLARRTGLRVGELARLELNCLVKNPGERYSLRVPLGKLHNERVIPIDKETASIIETIQRERGQRPATKDPEAGRPMELLFCSEEGRQRSRNTFLKRLKVVAKSCGISENVHPHRLRHTYATELLRYGVSLPGVMKLLGHQSLRMTLRYVEVTNEDLSKAYLNAVTKARQQYAGLKRIHIDKETSAPQGALETIGAAFDELVARIQTVRFDHPDLNNRKKLQRFVERLRRMQSDLPNFVE
jgi:integrase